jgi:hypothetical protein
VDPRVGAVAKPTLELVLEVEVVGEAAGGLERRLQIALQALDDPLRLRVAGLAEVPARPELAEIGGKPSVGRPSPA